MRYIRCAAQDETAGFYRTSPRKKKKERKREKFKYISVCYAISTKIPVTEFTLCLCYLTSLIQPGFYKLFHACYIYRRRAADDDYYNGPTRKVRERERDNVIVQQSFLKFSSLIRDV